MEACLPRRQFARRLATISLRFSSGVLLPTGGMEKREGRERRRKSTISRATTTTHILSLGIALGAQFETEAALKPGEGEDEENNVL